MQSLPIGVVSSYCATKTEVALGYLSGGGGVKSPSVEGLSCRSPALLGRQVSSDGMVGLRYHRCQPMSHGR
jgi:hypothetical protein